MSHLLLITTPKLIGDMGIISDGFITRSGVDQSLIDDLPQPRTWGMVNPLGHDHWVISFKNYDGFPESMEYYPVMTFLVDGKKFKSLTFALQEIQRRNVSAIMLVPFDCYNKFIAGCKTAGIKTTTFHANMPLAANDTLLQRSEA